MHRATVLLRDVLVLNDEVEFEMRKHLDTSETDFQAMQHLMRRGQMKPTELADALHVTSAGATTVIDRLVRRGHAERVPHPGDRRSVLIKPKEDATQSAMSVLRPMIDVTDAAVRQMPVEAQGAVVDYLESVVASMRDLLSELGSDPSSP
ncbi:MAG: MarR family winged helix-turn-helix transcriptional regulator [Propionibacteriaceae bacterium]